MLQDYISYEKSNSTTLIRISEISESINIVTTELILKYPNGSENSIYLIRPKENGYFPGIIFLHWLETHAENSNKEEFLPMAQKLAEQHDIVSILPDAFWATTPEKFEKNPQLWWTTEFNHDSRLVEIQLTNLLYAVDYFESLEYVNENNLLFCGHDFGAMFGTLLGTFKPNIKGYVLMALTGKFSDWFRFGNTLSTAKEFLEYAEKMSNYNPDNNIVDIKTEIFFQFALNDFYIPVEKAIELISQVKKNKKIKWYKVNHAMNSQAFDDAGNWLADLASN